MPVNIKVIRTKGVLKTALAEVLNFTVSKQALLDIAAQIEQPGEYEIWVDSRESDTMVSMVDTDQVDEMLTVHPPLRESKIALVTAMDDAKRAAFLETITVDRAVGANVVTGFEEATTWLGDPGAVVATANIK